MRDNLIRLLWIALCVVLQGPVTFRVAMAGLEVPLAAIEEQAPAFDVVVYGATSAGVVAAVQARRLGKSVVIVGPDRHLGGLSSGGLGFTDTGNKAVIGGLSREFYQRIWQHYDRAEAWRWQKREEYGNKGQGTPAIDGAQRTMWIFEPHVAEQVFEDLVAEHRDSRAPRRMARSRVGRRQERAADRVDSHAQWPDLYRTRLHRRDLRGRPDGVGRRRLPRRP